MKENKAREREEKRRRNWERMSNKREKGKREIQSESQEGIKGGRGGHSKLF